MDFFDQLQVFSERYLRTIKISEDLSPWGYDDWKDDAPIGAILHYTADNDFDRVLRWFMRAKYNARASANVVVADRRYPSVDELMEGLPLIKELPVTVVQCRPPDMPSWHASWTNHTLYGVELLNVGELRPGHIEGEWLSHWRRDHDPNEPEWSMPWSHPLKTPQPGWYRHWEPYSVEQIKACVMILRELRDLYQSALHPSWILGHEAVQGIHTIGAKNRDKRDPGPLLPVHGIRRAVFGVHDPITENPLGRLDEFVDQWVLFELQAGWEKRKDVWVKETTEKFEEPEPISPSTEVAWTRFDSAVRAMGAGSGTWGTVGKTAMRLLGYHIQFLHLDMYDEDRTAVHVFQKMMGLKADAIPGPRTRKALVERLEDRGILAAA